ncbi:hypothetical protein BJ878DRAFT_230295 [Calycina marina]|uniref:Uncharacterized protein n=1 Tax=Calycina marina TaxID=1763456 RepID=A0A9P7Z7J4_9HELO|nr:hypothetical protein BJ878DRAFT_230295 [Calycina marina]
MKDVSGLRYPASYHGCVLASWECCFSQATFLENICLSQHGHRWQQYVWIFREDRNRFATMSTSGVFRPHVPTESALRFIKSPPGVNINHLLIQSRKHELMHTEPDFCSVQHCKHPHFGDKGPIDRQALEVHSAPRIYYCLSSSCKRHPRRFPTSNLLEYQKQCRISQRSTAAMSTSISTKYPQSGMNDKTLESHDTDSGV